MIDAAELARLRERERNRHDLGLVSGLSFPELAALIDALEKAREDCGPKMLELETCLTREVERALHHKTACESARTERDSARALLRVCAGHVGFPVNKELRDSGRALLARIAAELGDAT